MEKDTIIISLGGSLVVPDKIDTGFLKNLKVCLSRYFDKYNFLIFVGGGKIARIYQKALDEFGANDEQKDWAGINVSRQNAEIVKQVFKDFCDQEIITDPEKELKSNKNIVLGAGWKPGRSTDYVSAVSAKTNKISTIINLTNIDYVFDKDPIKFPDARPVKEINWKNFRKIVGNKWTPGLSAPFDPEASKLAEKLKLKVVIINGKHLDRLEDLLNQKPFIGTTIQ